MTVGNRSAASVNCVGNLRRLATDRVKLRRTDGQTDKMSSSKLQAAWHRNLG